MRYCRNCIIPDTRPNIRFDADGICDACHAHASRPRIDWKAREGVFREAVHRAKDRSRGYDCLIPVSGGKDSTWQVVKCLEYGLNPLAVTWKTPARTDVGSRNLANLIRLGVDHIDYQISPKVESKFMRLAFERYGSTAIPMHMALFNIPLKIAVRFDIPLVVWGENSALEYGGGNAEAAGFKLDSAWLKRYGVTHGTTARDWISQTLTEKELTPYFGPDGAELERAGTLAVFLGYYFPWDPQTTFAIAKAHGFESSAEGPRTGTYDFADIDDEFISIHHYLKWFKFGFTRTYDNLSLEIRNGRLSRDAAIDVLRRRGDETPLADIARFCEFAGMSTGQFWTVAESFRNREIWTKRNGTWAISDFLIPDWRWT